MKKQIPPELDRIADTVLAYRPKAKAKASKQRQKRKAASAQIAKIPFPLSSYIARAFKP